MQPPTTLQVTLEAPVLQFQLELFSRALQAGLIAPEELAVASYLWRRLQHAVEVTIAQPTAQPADQPEVPHAD